MMDLEGQNRRTNTMMPYLHTLVVHANICFFTRSHAELGIINEDTHKTAKLSHGESGLARSSFTSMPVTATLTSKKAEMYSVLIHAEL